MLQIEVKNDNFQEGQNIEFEDEGDGIALNPGYLLNLFYFNATRCRLMTSYIQNLSKLFLVEQNFYLDFLFSILDQCVSA